jgi:hypothetical protein
MTNFLLAQPSFNSAYAPSLLYADALVFGLNDGLGPDQAVLFCPPAAFSLVYMP